jgi:hypothetical protein
MGESSQSQVARPTSAERFRRNSQRKARSLPSSIATRQWPRTAREIGGGGLWQHDIKMGEAQIKNIGSGAPLRRRPDRRHRVDRRVPGVRSGTHAHWSSDQRIWRLPNATLTATKGDHDVANHQ